VDEDQRRDDIGLMPATGLSSNSLSRFASSRIAFSLSNAFA